MSRFNLFNRGNSCPICDSNNGRCRETDGLLLCMTGTGKIAVPGYKFIGLTKDQTWGQWVLDNQREWTEQQRQHWQQEQQAKRDQRLEAENQRAATAMPAVERDRYYRQLLSPLNLHPTDRIDLVRRGFTDEQILESGFKSVEQWQKLDKTLPHILPGVNLDGRSLNTHSDGYLCPIRDVDGLIVGCQIRLRESEDGRYRWLTSKTKKRPKGATPHLPNGELPIAVFRPGKVTQPEIALVEGTGAKPFLTSQRLGMVAIGAAGGNFASSPETLQRILRTAVYKTAVLYPDAGAVQNPNVMRQYRSTWKLLQEWGYTVEVAWWGQTEKAAGDIDELGNFDNIWRISVEGFEAIAHPFEPKGKGFGDSTSEPKNDRDRYIQKRLMRFLGYWEDLIKDFTLSPTEKRKITYYRGYAPTFGLPVKSILLRGWLGAGKTEATLRSLLPHQDKRIIWLTGRNGLLRQTAKRAEKLGFTVYHYQDDPALYREMLRDGHPGIYMMCPDSLKNYATKHVDWSEAIAVIDEFSGVRREVLKKSAIMPEFERLLTECQHLIAIDAFLSNVDAGVISRYRRGSRDIYDQEFSQSKKKITWLECRNTDSDISLSHDGLIYPLLDGWVKEGKRIAIPTDSKLLAKACAEYLKSLGIKVWLCTSETVEENRALLPDPDGTLTSNDIQVVIYTPTAQSGLDVQTHFDVGLALYGGIISPLDFLQMIGRCRQCQEWFVSAPRRSTDPNCSTPSLESKRVKAWGEKLSTTFAELEVRQSSQTKGWGLWQSLVSNVEKAFHSEYLKSLLEHFFEVIETAETTTESKRWRKDVKAIKDDEIQATLTADLLNGQRLLREQKAPSKNSEVWDAALASEYDKYPNVWRSLIAQHTTLTKQANQANSGEEYKEFLKKADEVIALAKVFCTKRLDKLKNWVSATGENACSDLEDLQRSTKMQFTSYSSPRWKTLQNQSLFQALDLGKLASAPKDNANSKVEDGQRVDATIAHKTHYRIDSPIVGKLWAQFQQSPRLQRLFPTVETIQDFWVIVKQCMSFFGYESAGKTIRVATPGQPHANGKDRHGHDRTVESASLYFSGWLAMAESGSKTFQENFKLIVQAIRSRLGQERQSREEAREKERQYSPPMAPPMAA